MRSYRLKVEQFIRQHKHHLTIHKLHTNEPITAAELQELERLSCSMAMSAVQGSIDGGTG
jgi:type I site-specific restriction endonuclease